MVNDSHLFEITIFWDILYVFKQWTASSCVNQQYKD